MGQHLDPRPGSNRLGSPGDTAGTEQEKLQMVGIRGVSPDDYRRIGLRVLALPATSGVGLECGGRCHLGCHRIVEHT